jgi:large repetitive protein
VFLVLPALPHSVSAFNRSRTSTPTSTPPTPTPTPTGTSATPTSTPTGTIPTSTPTTPPLTFDTTGLTCSNGVCALPSGNVGTNYGQNIPISGGSGGPNGALPVFTVVAGSLPPGLTMPKTFGCCGTVIAGTPSQSGTFTFTIQVTDGAGDTARQGFIITVTSPRRPR